MYLGFPTFCVVNNAMMNVPVKVLSCIIGLHLCILLDVYLRVELPSHRVGLLNFLRRF